MVEIRRLLGVVNNKPRKVKPSTLCFRAQKLVEDGNLTQIEGVLTNGQCGRCIEGVFDEYVLGEEALYEDVDGKIVMKDDTMRFLGLDEEVIVPEEISKRTYTWNRAHLRDLLYQMNDNGFSFKEIGEFLKSIGK